MARTVATPLEKELININGIKHITSQSSRGVTWITLLFELGKDVDETAQEVQAALKRAEYSLPTDLDQSPTYHKANAHQESIIYLVLTSATSLFPNSTIMPITRRAARSADRWSRQSPGPWLSLCRTHPAKSRADGSARTYI